MHGSKTPGVLPWAPRRGGGGGLSRASSSIRQPTGQAGPPRKSSPVDGRSPPSHGPECPPAAPHLRRRPASCSRPRASPEKLEGPPPGAPLQALTAPFLGLEFAEASGGWWGKMGICMGHGMPRRLAPPLGPVLTLPPHLASLPCPGGPALPSLRCNRQQGVLLPGRLRMRLPPFGRAPPAVRLHLHCRS